MGRFHSPLVDADIEQIQTFPEQDFPRGQAVFVYYVKPTLAQAFQTRAQDDILLRLVKIIWSAQPKGLRGWWQDADGSDEAPQRAVNAVKDFISRYDQDLDHFYALVRGTPAMDNSSESGCESDGGVEIKREFDRDDVDEVKDVIMLDTDLDMASIKEEEDESSDELEDDDEVEGLKQEQGLTSASRLGSNKARTASGQTLFEELLLPMILADHSTMKHASAVAEADQLWNALSAQDHKYFAKAVGLRTRQVKADRHGIQRQVGQKERDRWQDSRHKRALKIYQTRKRGEPVKAPVTSAFLERGYPVSDQVSKDLVTEVAAGIRKRAAANRKLVLEGIGSDGSWITFSPDATGSYSFPRRAQRLFNFKGKPAPIKKLDKFLRPLVGWNRSAFPEVPAEVVSSKPIIPNFKKKPLDA